MAKAKLWGRPYGKTSRQMFEGAKARRLEKAAVKCKVFGCEHTSHDAKFIGSMCGPCWDYLVSGEVRANSRTLAGEVAQTSTSARAMARLDQVRLAVGICR